MTYGDMNIKGSALVGVPLIFVGDFGFLPPFFELFKYEAVKYLVVSYYSQPIVTITAAFTIVI